MRKYALTAYALVLIAFLVFGVIPYFQKNHDFPSAITSPNALEAITLVVVRPHGQVCMTDIAIDPRAREARFRAGTYKKPGPALTLTFRGHSYSATVPVKPGWADNALLAVPVPPPRTDDDLRVCIENHGANRIALYGAADRTRSRSFVTSNGRAEAADPTFGFWEHTPTTLAKRASTTVDRIAVFRGPLGHAWIVWTFLVLFALGLSGGGGWLVWRASAAEQAVGARAGDQHPRED